MKVVLGTET